MPTNVTIPAIGESITEGILARWLVAEGDWIEEGEALYELETDKVSSEVQAEVSGVVHRQVEEGETVEVGGVIGQIDESAERPEPSDGGAAADGASAPAQPDPDPAPTQDATADRPGHSDVAPAKATAGTTPTPSDDDLHRSSPAARRILDEAGVAVSTVRGSGPHGAVTKADARAHLARRQQGDQPPPRLARPAAGGNGRPESDATAGVSRTRMSPLRKAIAQRLVNAQRTAAILTTFNEVDMSRCQELRGRYKEAFAEKHQTGLGYMSFFGRATAVALGDFPLINSWIDGDDIVTPERVNLGIAVGTERGLVVPVLREADRMSFADIERGIREFAKRARDGKLTIEDMEGGTFTITNGGVYGSLLSTPIINPPQSGILGMHGIKDRPVAIDGEVHIRPMMYIALSYDHRIVDGAGAVGFLNRIKELIEEPEKLLLDL